MDDLILNKKQLIERMGIDADPISSAELFWNNCPPGYAHLVDKRNLTGNYLSKLQQEFIDVINWENKTIIDYGCGGGWLGLYLFKEKNLKKYVGIDIASRSLRVAAERLKKYNCEFHLIPFTFKNADIFVSQACIQHFPNEEFLIDFLRNINQSTIHTVMLHIRYAQETIFSGAYLNEDAGIGSACLTNENYILNYLSNYKLLKGNLIDIGTPHKYLILERLENEY